MTDLKSLDDHNRQRLADAIASRKPRPNGIACPQCGAELLDSDPSACLTSNPPKTYVHCDACEYRGYRNL